jgi:hypothetical protein
MSQSYQLNQQLSYHKKLPYRNTASAEPIQSMQSQLQTQWISYSGHNCASAPPSSQAPAPKRGRPKAPPRPAYPSRPVHILPAPMSNNSAAAQPYVSSSQSSTASRFYHGPTSLPPVPYSGNGGLSSSSHGQHSKINDRQSQMLPNFEARLERLEDAVGKYVDHRAEQALARSVLPKKKWNTNDFANYLILNSNRTILRS